MLNSRSILQCSAKAALLMALKKSIWPREIPNGCAAGPVRFSVGPNLPFIVKVMAQISL